MKRVVAYIGTKRTDSNTIYFLKEIFKRIQKFMEMELSIITPKDYRIFSCSGCQKCFMTGKCSQSDKLNEVIEQMCSADLLIVGSPVYFHGVSGDTKILIDRLSAASHILKFSGKLALVISTCSNNGHNTAVDVLEKYMTTLGANVIAKRNAATNYPEQLFNKQWLDENCEELAKKVVDAWRNDDYINDRLEQSFATYKKIMKYRYDAKDTSFEPTYWKESGMLDSKNFSDYVMNYKIKGLLKDA